MSAAESLLSELQSRGAKLAVAGDHLRIEAPKGAVSPELLAELRARKPELLELLTSSAEDSTPAYAWPFPCSDTVH